MRGGPGFRFDAVGFVSPWGYSVRWLDVLGSVTVTLSTRLASDAGTLTFRPFSARLFSCLTMRSVCYFRK